MKTFPILLLQLLLSYICFSQKIDSLQRKKQKLLSNIILLQDSIKYIDSQIDYTMKMAIYKVDENQTLKVTVKESSPIKLLPELTARNIGFTKKSDTIITYQKIYEDGNTRFLKAADSGFLYIKYLNQSDDLIGLIKKFDAEKDSIGIIQNEVYQKQKQKNYEAKKAKLIAAFGQENAKKILEGKIWLGMTANMAVQSWGRPEKINTTVGTFGKHEQWIYPNNEYLYFENDILTGWQD